MCSALCVSDVADRSSSLAVGGCLISRFGDRRWGLHGAFGGGAILRLSAVLLHAYFPWSYHQIPM